MINKKRSTLLIAALLWPLPALAQSDSDRADQLLREGMTLGEAKKWTEARDKMREALALKKSYDVAGNLGLVEAELQDWRAAAEHLDYARSVFPMRGKPESRERIERVLAEAKSKVGCFKITVNVDGARVKVGDRDIGSTPIGDAVCAYPGPTTVAVTRDGYQPASESVTLAMGQDTTVSIKLSPAQGSDPGPGDTSARPIWPAIVLGGVGAAWLAVGIAGVVVGAQKDSDATELAGSASCRPAITAACLSDGADLASDWSTFNTVGIVGFSVGGAALVGMTIYLLVPTSETEKTAWQVVPWLDAQTAGVTVGHAF